VKTEVKMEPMEGKVKAEVKVKVKVKGDSFSCIL
jgi:hypothetical protein